MTAEVLYFESRESGPVGTEPGGMETSPPKPQSHPLKNEGVFSFSDIENNQIHELYGEINVGAGTTYYKAYFPEQRSQTGIGYVFAGFGGFLKSSEGLGKAMARAGLATIITDPSRFSESMWEDFTDPQKLHVKTAEEAFHHLEKNPGLQHMPEGHAALQEKRLIVAHSMGGLAASRFALEHSNEVEMLAFLKTVGVNKPIAFQFMKSIANGNAAGAILHELVPYLQSDDIEISWKNAARFARYFGMRRPGQNDTRLSRPLGEMVSCLTTDTRPILQRLGEAGINRLYVEAGRDILIKSDYDIGAYFDKIFMLKKYGHLAPQCRPALITDVVLSARADFAHGNPARV